MHHNQPSMITSFDQLDLSKRYTYADYLTWKFKERVELLRGKVLKMSPAPNRRHQKISIKLSYLIMQHLDGKACQAYTAPFDVRLPLPEARQEQGKADTVVQPDIVVVCDLAKLDEQGCNGAPDLLIEILSPGNSKREMKDKMELYESAGVPEYWIVDPLRECVTCYHLNEAGQYQSGAPFFAEDDIPSRVLKGFVIKGSEILNELEDLE